MKYHTISTSKTGHGAIFTNAREAKEYQSNHPGSVYQVFDAIPLKIPAIRMKTTEPVNSARSLNATSDGITIYTDGSALNNPGPGGYGIVMQMTNGRTLEMSQGYRHTTNNRMEMLAVITALENIEDHDSPVTIHSDSQYTINGIVKGWAKGWRNRNWKKSDGKPALNPDLWSIMLDLVEQFPKLTFKWVKGHAGNVLNERADVLANSAASQGGGTMRVDEGYVKK